MMVGVPRTFADLSQLSAYKDLHNTVAEATRPLVALVGSGLSAPAGLPSWAGLKACLVEELRAKAVRAANPADVTRMAEEADSIAGSNNPWVAFGRLETALGKTTYQAIIRNKLSPADTQSIPPVYGALWRAPVEGVLSVNLDNFVKRSFSEVYPGRDLKWFTGRQAARLAKVLHAGQPFAFSLHGSIDDTESWVFTHDQLRDLYRDRGYKAMLSGIFTSYTVLFLGISADDTAVGSPLEQLIQAHIQGPTHYWLTDRSDPTTESWAESVGIRVLPYAVSGNDHSIVGDALGDLSGAVGTEIQAPPVLLRSGSSGAEATHLPSPPDLVVMPLPQIRQLLNDRAVQLLDGPDGLRRYEQFLLDYEEPIHRAWFIPSAAVQKELFGYELGERVARGAFGQVYESLDPAGRQVAVKVLHEEIMHDHQLLESFRRGVRAMQILERRQVPGMVAYEKASEIPTFVVMEWVEGPNLSAAKEAGILDEWAEILWVSLELVKIIKRAHDLPERVLHRDIRPANIMLRNGWLGQGEWELVVLDFDLSTYRGAAQKSVLAKESALGFLAPEQLDVERSTYSTRNAAVDSFGVGMTLLFLCGGVEPEAYAQRRPGFTSLVKGAMSRPKNTTWLSLPGRFSRMILGATNDEQPRRWDLAQILVEIQRLQHAVAGGDGPIDLDLLCEEIAARCPGISDIYDWDADVESVVVKRPGGLSLEMHGAREDDRITLSINWVATGVEDRGSVTKYLPERLQRCAAALRSGPWEMIRSIERNRMDISLTAVLAADSASRRLDAAADSLSKAVEAMRFM